MMYQISTNVRNWLVAYLTQTPKLPLNHKEINTILNDIRPIQEKTPSTIKKPPEKGTIKKATVKKAVKTVIEKQSTNKKTKK